MSTKGIGIEGIASEIGALGRENLYIEKDELLKGIMRRFGAELWEAKNALKEAIEVNAVYEKGSKVYIKLLTTKDDASEEKNI